jgi:hypothetical protein
VLVFSPHFPTYPPNIFRRSARVVLSQLKASNDFRPSLEDVRRFLADDKSPRCFPEQPHNPTGGVATFEDLKAIADRPRQGRGGVQRRAAATGWSGAAGTIRFSSSRACSITRWRPTRSASRTA